MCLPWEAKLKVNLKLGQFIIRNCARMNTLHQGSIRMVSRKYSTHSVLQEDSLTGTSVSVPLVHNLCMMKALAN